MFRIASGSTLGLADTERCVRLLDGLGAGGRGGLLEFFDAGVGLTVARGYAGRTGSAPLVIPGSSPGAAAFGSLRLSGAARRRARSLQEDNLIRVRASGRLY